MFWLLKCLTRECIWLPVNYNDCWLYMDTQGNLQIYKSVNYNDCWLYMDTQGNLQIYKSFNSPTTST